MIDRRQFISSVAAGVATGPAAIDAEAAQTRQASTAGAPARASVPGLAALAFEPLPLGPIRPTGWLHSQLRIQADGLSGHLDEFWPDVAESGWIGGSAEGWERGPYWLDGIVPLAHLLHDDALLAKTGHWIDEILIAPAGRRLAWPVRDASSDGPARPRPVAGLRPRRH